MRLQPSVRHCFVCGVENHSGLHMRFFETEGYPRDVHVDYCVPRRFEGFPGMVHGGVITAMLDEACWRTVFRGDPVRYLVTARLTVRYRKPVPIETPIHIDARVVEDKGRVVVTAGEIHDAQGNLLVEADVVLAEVDAGAYSIHMSEADWSFYPETEEEQ